MRSGRSIGRAWVTVGELETMERVQILGATAAVLNIINRPHVEAVYNLEVQGQHVYRVSPAGVLVHNASANQVCKVPLKNIEGPDTLFGQARVDPTFSANPRVPRELRGKELTEVADAIAKGNFDPRLLQLDIIRLTTGQLVTEGNRRLATLALAGLRPKAYTIFDLKNYTYGAKILERFADTPVVPAVSRLPARSIAVTPSMADLTIVRIIELPF